MTQPRSDGRRFGPSSKAESDAAIVEAGFALLTAAVLGALAFAVVVAVAPPWVAAVVGGGVALLRLVSGLLRARRPLSPTVPDQPSQPGRTSPDS